MSNADASDRVQLADAGLTIGQPVQIVVSRPTPSKHYTRLIGFVEREFVMLRVPMENGWPVVLQEGMAVQVRAFSGVCIFDFPSSLQTVLLHPRNYMFLDYPAEVRQTRLRAHERVRCSVPAQVLKVGSGAAPAGEYRFHDLSVAGGALVGPAALGAVGQSLLLSFGFRLEATGSEEHLTLAATVQSVRAVPDQSGQASAYQHGIHFDQVDARVALLVSELGASR